MISSKQKMQTTGHINFENCGRRTTVGWEDLGLPIMLRPTGKRRFDETYVPIGAKLIE